MLNPAKMFRMLAEMIFILLGGFLLWIGLSGRFLLSFDPRQPAWFILAAALVYWGARAWMKTTRGVRTSERTLSRLGGVSLLAVGLLMLGLVFAQLRFVGPGLALAGGILTARGLVNAVLALRTD